MKIRTGDTVIVHRGGHKGQTGEVMRVLTANNQVVVKGVNLRTRHVKPSGARQVGGLEKSEQPISIANVNLVHPTSKGKSSRVGFKFKKDGAKTRVYRQAADKEVK